MQIAGVGDDMLRVVLSQWYKEQKARKEAPNLMRWAIASPLIGAICIAAARWVLRDTPDFLTDEQVNFMVATLLMMGVPAMAFCGYCVVRLVKLQKQSGLTAAQLLLQTSERD